MMQSKIGAIGSFGGLFLTMLLLVGCATVEPYKVEVSGGEKREYEQAYNQLQNGNTKRSIEQFNAFLIKHPTGQYSNKAQYWLGVANRVAPLTFNGSAEIKKEMPKKTTSVNLVSGSEKQEYQQAYNQLRNGNTKESIGQFNAFLIKHPAGEYANNAQYWLGEAYRVDQNNDAARKAFNDVIEKYPDGVKVPDALLRLGMLEMEQGNNGKAIEYFVRVATEYPNSSVGPIAEKKLHTLGVTEIKKIDKPIKLKPKQAVIPPASNSTVDIKEMPKKTTSVNLDEFKAQCKELGFKAGTQDFGNCVLELNEGK